MINISDIAISGHAVFVLFCIKLYYFSGASSGIGAGTALELAKHGTRLVLTGRNRSALQAVADQCLQEGAKEVSGG